MELEENFGLVPREITFANMNEKTSDYETIRIYQNFISVTFIYGLCEKVENIKNVCF